MLGILKYFAKPVILLLLSTLSLSCSDDKNSPDTQIHSFFESTRLAVERRAHDDIANLIHPDYRDHNGLNKKQLVQLLRGYFFRHRHIYLVNQIRSIEWQDNTHAFVVLYVAMAGKKIETLDTLQGLGARIIRLECQLIKDRHWRLLQAKWRDASISEMLQD